MFHIKLIEVAKAICAANGDDWNREGGGYLEAYVVQARAAIQALMTPTEDMIYEGGKSIYELVEDDYYYEDDEPSSKTARGFARGSYVIMLQTILDEESKL